MKIKTLKNFKDLQEGISRVTGDVFVVSKERFEEINSKLPGFVEEVKEEKKGAENETRAIKRPRKGSTKNKNK